MAEQWGKTVKTVAKTGKNSGVRISFHYFNIIFILAVTSFLASFRPILDLNSNQIVNVMQY